MSWARCAEGPPDNGLFVTPLGPPAEGYAKHADHLGLFRNSHPDVKGDVVKGDVGSNAT